MAKAMREAYASARLNTLASVVKNPEKPHIYFFKKFSHAFCKTCLSPNLAFDGGLINLVVLINLCVAKSTRELSNFIRQQPW
jgi:hypothetical protein